MLEAGLRLNPMTAAADEDVEGARIRAFMARRSHDPPRMQLGKATAKPFEPADVLIAAQRRPRPTIPEVDLQLSSLAEECAVVRVRAARKRRVQLENGAQIVLHRHIDRVACAQDRSLAGVHTCEARASNSVEEIDVVAREIEQYAAAERRIAAPTFHGFRQPGKAALNAQELPEPVRTNDRNGVFDARIKAEVIAEHRDAPGALPRVDNCVRVDKARREGLFKVDVLAGSERSRGHVTIGGRRHCNDDCLHIGIRIESFNGVVASGVWKSARRQMPAFGRAVREGRHSDIGMRLKVRHMNNVGDPSASDDADAKNPFCPRHSVMLLHALQNPHRRTLSLTHRDSSIALATAVFCAGTAVGPDAADRAK